jgi:regulator of replication initiation timing
MLDLKKTICKDYERKLRKLSKKYTDLKQEKMDLILENEKLQDELIKIKEKYRIHDKRVVKHYEAYKIKGLSDGLFKFSNGHVSTFDIHQVLEIKNNLYNYNTYPTILSFQEIVYLTEPSLERLIWNVENGIFDRYL